MDAGRSRGVAISLLLVAGCGGDACAQADSLSLESVLVAQERAIGDMRALRSVWLDVVVRETGSTYDLTVRMLRPARLRVDLRRFGLSVYSEGFGRQGPWQQHLLQWSPRTTSAAGAVAIVNGMEASPWGRSLRELRGRGHTVELLPDGASSELGVRVVLRNGTRRDYFIHPRNFRILRSRQSFALHPDHAGDAGAAREIESAYLEYRRIEGYVFPMRIENRERASGRLLQSFDVRALRVNEPMKPALFDGR